MIAKKIRSFLDEKGVKYVAISHSPAYTAQEIAAMVHVPGKEMAKTVIVSMDDRLAMVVLPASTRVSFDELRKVVGTKNVRLAHEDEFAKYFADCEVGAMPPFGNLYGFDVYVDPALTEDDEIFFNAGSHTELIRMAYADFERLVEPRVVAVTII
jgi:Ala-tRNA(Pro) deacylase